MALACSMVSCINLDPEKDFDLVSKDQDTTEDKGVSEQMTPDINCLVNDFPEFFGFPEAEINARIVP